MKPEWIEKAKGVKSAEELLALAKENNVELSAEEAAAYFAQLNPKCGAVLDDELENVSGGGCGGSAAVLYEDSMCGRRAYHPTSGNTYTILGPCPGDPAKALVRNVYSGDEGYASLSILAIE